MRKSTLVCFLGLAACAPSQEITYELVKTRDDARPANEAAAKCRLVAMQVQQQEAMIGAMTPAPTDFASRYIAAGRARGPSQASQAFDDCMTVEGYQFVPRVVLQPN